MKHLGDITKINGNTVPPVEVVIGGSPCQDLSIAGKREGLQGERSGLFMEQLRIIKEMRKADEQAGRTGTEVRPRYMVWENVCFAAGTLITTDKGYVPIEQINVGDRVKTLGGTYEEVAQIHITENQEVLSLHTRGSEPLTVTPNHPFYAREKKYKGIQCVGIDPPKWVSASELTKNHLIGYKLDTPTLPDGYITESEAWAIGRWLADGSVDLSKSNPRIFISCGISKVEQTREMLSQLPYNIHENHPHPTAVNFAFTSAEFYRLIKDAGKGAGYKKVPPYIFNLPHFLQKAVVDGYLSGDGYIRQRGKCIEISAHTASRQLAYGIARLLRNAYHISAIITKSVAKDGKIGERIIHANFPTYAIYASFTSIAKRSVFDEKEGIVWQPVKSITPIKERVTVYNLSVKEDNTYGANDIIVHNCGSFSSNSGEDFRTVLEETARVKSADTVIPRPPQGKWKPSGCIMGDGWSIAWRVFDAQFWGVPQRRKRVALVADFGGQSAPEILFEQKGLSRDIIKSRKKREEITTTATDGIRAAGYDGYNGDLTGDKSSSLGTNCGMSIGRNGVIETRIGEDTVEQIEEFLQSVNSQAKHQQDLIQHDLGVARTLACGTHASGSHLTKTLVTKGMLNKIYGISAYNSNAMLSDNPDSGIYEADTARTLDTCGGNPACNQGGIAVVCVGKEDNEPCNSDEQPVYCIDQQGGKGNANYDENIACTLMSDSHGTPHAVCYEKPCDVVAFTQNQRDEVRDLEGIAGSLSAEQGSHQQTYVMQHMDGTPCAACHEESCERVPIAFNGQSSATMCLCAEIDRSPTLRVGQITHVMDLRPMETSGATQSQSDSIQHIGCDLYGGCITGDVLPTVTANTGSSATHTGGTILSINCKQMGLDIGDDVASTLVGSGYKEQQAVFSCATTWDGQQIIGTLSASNANGSQRMPDKENFNANIDCRKRACGFYPQMKAESMTFTEDKACCIVNGTNPGFHNGVVTPRSVARRLTPLECERLQGYPDYWTDIGQWIDTEGKLHKESSDSARYKALGNSIALPQWLWLLVRLNRYCKEHTMASLFDGIGGFPLIWETINGLGSCLWASEIEEFPIAVTKHWLDGKTPLPQLSFEVVSAEPLVEEKPLYKKISWDDLLQEEATE